MELADAIQSLIENPDLHYKMGIGGREIVVSEFALGKKVVSETMVVYEELLKQ